jgi:intraflagellar transport protein 52
LDSLCARLTPHVCPSLHDPQHVLSEVFRRIAQYKMGSLGLGQTLDPLGEGEMPAASQFGDGLEL